PESSASPSLERRLSHQTQYHAVSRRRMRVIMATGSIVRDFDRIMVGVGDVHRLDRADRPGPWPRPHGDGHAAAFEICDNLGERRLGDEAEMGRHPLFTGMPGDVI